MVTGQAVNAVANAITGKWAILVGINNYQYVSPLKFAENDIKEVGRKFRETLEFPLENIIEISDTSDILPQREAILHELGTLALANRVQPDDLLVFYFAGHGMIDPQENKDYLLPLGASPAALQDTGIQVDRIVNYLKKTGCKNIVLFIDACRNEVEGARGTGISIGENSKDVLEREGIVTFFSCSPHDLSYEIEELKHGSFTYNVLQAIESQECSTVEQVDKYLRTNVQITNADKKKPVQKPYTIISPLDKKDLQIFISHKIVDEFSDSIDDICDKLCDLLSKHLVDTQTYDLAIDIADKARQNKLDEFENTVYERMKELKEDRLTVRGFVVFMNSVLRRRFNRPVLSTRLEKL